MAINSAFRLGRTLTLQDAQSENALEELRNNLQNELNVGTSAPDSNTTGHIYFQLGATTGDAVKIYVKDRNGNWNGG